MHLVYERHSPEDRCMGHAIVAIGGSAGALEPLRQIVGELPASLPATVLIAIHTSPAAPSALPSLLDRHAALPVAFAADGTVIEPGRVWVAPPGHHLLVADRRLIVTRGPRENGFRPAIDPLFRTAARGYGAQVIGIVLSGALDDGTQGLACIKEAGGVAIVQHPDDAACNGMPTSAIRNVAVDHIAAASDIAPLVTRLVEQVSAAEETSMPANDQPDPAVAGAHVLRDGSQSGPPTVFTCPECGGTLWERINGTLMSFTCHVGHTYAPEALESGMAITLESALWTAVRTLEENAAFYRRMHSRAAERGLSEIGASYATKARETTDRADVIRSVLTTDAVAPPHHSGRPDDPAASI
jgi:two-component system chemotaxis response regulator CheB